MPTIDMLKEVYHTVRMRDKPPFKIAVFLSADDSHVKEIKQIKFKLSPFQLNI